MRLLLGLLLLLNAGMFYLVWQEPAQHDPLASQVATNLPPLTLISEKAPAVATEPVSVAVPTPTQEPEPTTGDSISGVPVTERKVPGTKEATPSEVNNVTANVVDTAPRAVFLELACYSLGPFNNDKGAATASQTLNDLGLVTRKQYETRQELSGYWVYIPPFPSRSDARKVTQMLKGRGVKDYLIIANGEKKNAISLGFFRTREAAEQHRAHMQALGLAPQLEASYRENKGLWLDFSSPNQPPLPVAIIDALQSQFDGVSMQKRPCS